MVFKLNGYIFKGRNSDMFILASLLRGYQVLMKRIRSFRSEFFPLRLDPILEGLRHRGK